MEELVTKLDFCSFPIVAQNAEPYLVPIEAVISPQEMKFRDLFKLLQEEGGPEIALNFLLDLTDQYTIFVCQDQEDFLLRFFGLSFPPSEMPEITATTEM